MLGEFNNPNGASGGSQPFPPNPFGSAPNPFGGAQTSFPGPSAQNPFGPTPFSGQPSMFNSPAPGNDNFNVDELVKRIDAKIAELEEEERKEKEKLNNSQNIYDKPSTDATKEINKPVEKVVENLIVEDKIVENIPREPIIENIPQEKNEIEEKTTIKSVENKVDAVNPQPKIEKHVEKIEARDKNYVTDDQFFDDFFSDDE